MGKKSFFVSILLLFLAFERCLKTQCFIEAGFPVSSLSVDLEKFKMISDEFIKYISTPDGSK